MTHKEIQELLALAAKATPGDWGYSDLSVGFRQRFANDDKSTNFGI